MNTFSDFTDAIWNSLTEKVRENAELKMRENAELQSVHLNGQSVHTEVENLAERLHKAADRILELEEKLRLREVEHEYNMVTRCPEAERCGLLAESQHECASARHQRDIALLRVQEKPPNTST